MATPAARARSPSACHSLGVIQTSVGGSKIVRSCPACRRECYDHGSVTAAGFLGGRLVRRLAAEGGRHGGSGVPTVRGAPCGAGLDQVAAGRRRARRGFGRCRRRGGRRRRQRGVRLSREGRRDFRVRPPARRREVAWEAAAAGAARLVRLRDRRHPESASPYIGARGRGELVVQQAFPGATIVRPGAMLVQATPCSARSPTSPGCSLCSDVGGGRTRLQPV